MADHAIGNQHGFAAVAVGDADSRTNLSGTTDPQGNFEDDDMDSITAMRARLAAIDAAYYTSARLNQMSYNDMVYAIRVNDHPATIRQ